MNRDEFTNNGRYRHFKRSNLYNVANNCAPTLLESYMDENHNDFSNPFTVNPCLLASLSINSNQQDRPPRPPFFTAKIRKMSGKSGKSQENASKFTFLPQAALDENGEIRSDWTVKTVIDEGLLMIFVMDKTGCHFLQQELPSLEAPHVDELDRARIYAEILASADHFHAVATNMFGNFFLQKLIEHARAAEQDCIRKYLTADISEYCLDKSACRVVQTALERMKPKHADLLVEAIPRDENLRAICTDQNANHVIQKVVRKIPPKKWEFIVDFITEEKDVIAELDAVPNNLMDICTDKYGCRVVQTIIEVLGGAETGEFDKLRPLHRIMQSIICRCKALTSNEFANYIIQHIIETPGILSEYRNAIIEKCLLTNLLSMSQEKYASHVVERAFTFAPLPYLAEMMDEIFDGYLPHPETGKDALDILMFHQFGNYVIQRILHICCSSVLDNRLFCKETLIDGVECDLKFNEWLRKLSARARKEKLRLSRFSSGKKILEILETMNTPYELEPRRHRHLGPAHAMFVPSAQEFANIDEDDDFFAKFD
ncbi:unnamed protein product [Caenorhabditis sp. 36 PRJEB53466]|nr:unnamed protein product [Caenorhabditis sp. 36 PRJEB53466]